jgi:hypothetical protein
MLPQRVDQLLILHAASNMDTRTIFGDLDIRKLPCPDAYTVFEATKVL